MKKALALILTALLSLALYVPALAAGEDLPFTDVASGAWYADAVAYVYEKGLMNGTGESTFSPKQALTRAQLVTILWRRAGAPAVDHALPSDVSPSAWYAEAARWAASQDQDASGAFCAKEIVTRESAVALLWQTARSLGADVSVGEDTNILSYDDAFDVSAYAMPAMQWAVGAGVIEGIGAKLDPQGRLSRAQAAVMLQRFDTALTADPLSLWTADAALKTRLTAFMEAITDPESADFIPVADRVAVFDMDGTLFCETDPIYFDHMLFLYRVTEDPDYKDKASDFEKEVAAQIQSEFIEKGVYPAGMDNLHGQGVASAFAGMTLDEFDAYIQEFKQRPMPGYEGMNMGDGFYLPMVQVVEYLQANDFTVYIVSGTDRLIVRGLFKDNVLDIPNSQLIGSDELIVATNQGDADGLDYFFVEGDELLLGGEFLIKNLKMNKVAVIAQEIGRQPVLSFGNSSGDGSMANYVIHNNPYRAMAFMLCCDDTVRENGDLAKADKMAAQCAQYGWIAVSMKNDWTTIYGDGVTYLGAAADAAA